MAGLQEDLIRLKRVSLKLIKLLAWEISMSIANFSGKVLTSFSYVYGILCALKLYGLIN